MKLKLTIEVPENQAEGRNKIDRILAKVSVWSRSVGGTISDGQGRRVGEWELAEDSDDPALFV